MVYVLRSLISQEIGVHYLSCSEFNLTLRDLCLLAHNSYELPYYGLVNKSKIVQQYSLKQKPHFLSFRIKDL